MANLVTLTDSASGVILYQDTKNVLYAETSGSGSKVTYLNDEGNSKRQIIVDESPSALETAAAEVLYQITPTGGVATVFNIERIKDVVVDGSGSKLYYDDDGTSLKEFTTATAAATLVSAINAL